MLTNITISNYRSIKNASMPLSPFTLLIGANGAGKSNFLRFLSDISGVTAQTLSEFHTQNRHVNYLGNTPTHNLDTSTESLHFFPTPETEYDPKLTHHRIDAMDTRPLIEFKTVLEAKIYTLQPDRLKQTEALTTDPWVQADGSGTITVLDALKTGDREDLFDLIEATFKTYIPDIEKLSFVTKDTGKYLQVRDKHLDTLVPFSQLSDGTSLVLMMLTLIYQPHPPALICIEDIDHGLHPRLFDKIIQLCFDITSNDSKAPQIIATTHNPYVVDRFKDHESAVLMVEKIQGCTHFTTLAEKIQHLDPGEDPLGALWYSGMADACDVSQFCKLRATGAYRVI